MTRRVAAVDLGTNSARVLIAESRDGGEFRTLQRRLKVVRLGQDVDRTGRLADTAIARTVATVQGYAELWRDAGVTDVRVTATSAARDAANGDRFAEAIREVAGVTPEVLSGEAEGRLAFAGATADLDPDDAPFAVLDIGGGSTEMVVGTRRAERQTSRQLGSVRLTERVLTADPPTASEIDTARQVVDEELDAMRRLTAPEKARTFVAVAGTATTLAAVHAGLEEYVDGAVHGMRITAADLAALSERLLTLTAGQIAVLGAVQEGREDVLAAGALILAQAVAHFGFPAVRISESDLLDGMVLEMLAQYR